LATNTKNEYCEYERTDDVDFGGQASATSPPAATGHPHASVPSQPHHSKSLLLPDFFLFAFAFNLAGRVFLPILTPDNPNPAPASPSPKRVI